MLVLCHLYKTVFYVNTLDDFIKTLKDERVIKKTDFNFFKILQSNKTTRFKLQSMLIHITSYNTIYNIVIMTDV